MKFNFLILAFFIFFSCSSLNVKNSKISHSSSGFALIYSENDYKNKLIDRKFDNNKILIGHNKLKIGTILKITNPDNKKVVKLKISKK